MGTLTGLTQASLTKICSYVDLDQRGLLDVTGSDPSLTLVYDDSIQSQITAGQNASVAKPDPVALTRSTFTQSVPTSDVWVQVSSVAYTVAVAAVYGVSLYVTQAVTGREVACRIFVNGVLETGNVAVTSGWGAMIPYASCSFYRVLAKGDVLTVEVATHNNTSTVSGTFVVAALDPGF